MQKSLRTITKILILIQYFIVIVEDRSWEMNSPGRSTWGSRPQTSCRPRYRTRRSSWGRRRASRAAAWRRTRNRPPPPANTNIHQPGLHKYKCKSRTQWPVLHKVVCGRWRASGKSEILLHNEPVQLRWCVWRLDYSSSKVKGFKW